MKKAIFILVMSLTIGGSQLAARASSVSDAVVAKFQTFYNASQWDSIYSMLSDRSRQMLPPDKTSAAMTQLSGQAGAFLSYTFTKEEHGMFYYKTAFKNATLQLLLSLSADNRLDVFRFLPDNGDAQAGADDKSAFVVATPTGKLYGSLVMPEGDKKVPVVLIIAGSGPTDRNGNNNAGLKTNAYQMIADSLKAAGIASVRYDKRGVGASAGALKDESSVDFNVYVDDAAAFAKKLKEDSRFSEVIVAGHSEGSLIGMIVAEKEHVKKYISIAGAGERIDKTIIDQVNAQSPEVAEQARKIMDSLRMGQEIKYVPQVLESLFRPSIQPFMKTWLKYDPQVEIKKLKMPVLIVQGKNDLQVSVKNAELLKKAEPKATLLYFDHMNHILKDVPEDKEINYASYGNPVLPLTGGLMTAIVQFIKQ